MAYYLPTKIKKKIVCEVNIKWADTQNHRFLFTGNIKINFFYKIIKISFCVPHKIQQGAPEKKTS